MNTKKSIIYFLLLITVLVGIFTIYLASKLKYNTETQILISPMVTFIPTQKNTITPYDTSEPTIIPSVSPIASGAVDISITNPADIVCGSSCDTGTCVSGNVCAKINNVKKCVLASCVTLQNDQYIDNGNCDQDLCTLENAIQIIKTSALSCSNDQNSRKIKFIIKISNPAGNTDQRTKLTVLDQFNTNFKESYIVSGSISDGGSLSDGRITWTNLTLSSNGGSKELSYEALVPVSDKDKDYSNLVIVSENDVQRGSYQFSSSLNILPCTALISDSIDRLLLGLCILIFGVYIFKNNLHYTLGYKYWKYGGKKIDDLFKELIFKIKYEAKGNFERHLVEDDDINNNN